MPVHERIPINSRPIAGALAAVIAIGSFCRAQAIAFSAGLKGGGLGIADFYGKDAAIFTNGIEARGDTQFVYAGGGVLSAAFNIGYAHCL